MRGDDLLRRLAPYAGILGGLLLFAAAGVALVVGTASPALVWLLIAAGLLLLFFVVTDPQVVVNALKLRGVRYGSNAGLMTVVFIGIFIVINFLAVKHNVQWDFTQSGRYTLSSATVKLVKGLKQPVHIIAFYAKGPGGQSSGESAAKLLLQRYTALSHEISVTFVDPDVNPALARQYHVTVSPTIVVTSNGHEDAVQLAAEQDISSAIENVIEGKTPVVYFLTGNGEPSLQPASGPSFSSLVSFLKKNNLQAKPLSLLTVSAIPSDAAAVVEAAPTTPYSPKEKEILLSYLEHGGHVLYFAEPFGKVDMNWLLKPFGLSVSEGLVADLSPSGSLPNQPQAIVIQAYDRGSVVKHQLPPGVYLDATSINVPAKPPAGVTVEPIAQTSQQSFLVTNPKATAINPATDKRGPFAIAVSAEKPVASATAKPAATPTPSPAGPGSSPSTGAVSRLVVFGSTLFATDQVLTANPSIGEGNSEAAAAALQWLTESPNHIVIPTKTPADRSMVLVGWQSNALVFVNTLFVPAIVLFAGVVVWLRRR
ncbi:MAG: GldG family protein [Chloroflexi bacterium]|nr:GldG family protein [Chloroflexota bacterium]